MKRKVCFMKCWCWYHLHNAIEKYASANSPWCFLSKRYNDCQFFQGWNIRAQTKKYFVCINFEMNVCYFLKAMFRIYVVLVLTQLISHDYINVKLKIATHQTSNLFLPTRCVVFRETSGRTVCFRSPKIETGRKIS